jgi:ATP adenylyltransferase
MKVIWAPWRMAYITSSHKRSACIFCHKPRERRDASNLVLHRGRHGFVVMNRFPYNSGHLMVAPYAHVKSLESLRAEIVLELLKLTRLSLQVLRAEIRPEGFNIGINLGRVSGAGIEGHLHLHIVPRWNGDTNFMPLFAETRVIPEHLDATYRKLHDRFGRLSALRSGRQRASDGVVRQVRTPTGSRRRRKERRSRR